MQIIYTLEIDSHYTNKLLFKNIFSNHYSLYAQRQLLITRPNNTNNNEIMNNDVISFNYIIIYVRNNF